MTSKHHSLKRTAFAAITLAMGIAVPTFAIDCKALPTPKAITGNTVLISSTVARPNDGIDDTAAIQAVLDTLNPGDALVFDLPGVYQHNTAFHIRRPGVIFDGGSVAEFRGTNVSDQAILIESDDVEVRNTIINNVTDQRRNEPKQKGIAAYSTNSGITRLHRISILSNIIRGDGTTSDPGTPTQAATSSNAIFLYNTDGFVVAGNTVYRSLADGIHMTGGSRNGRVINNTIQEGGDDGIAIVSQLDKVVASQPDPGAYLGTVDPTRSTNILIYNNTVKGNYLGRGIAVVGGKDITIEKNSSLQITHGAGIYIARETGYNTMGDKNVYILNNTITDIGKTDAIFVPKGPGFVAQNNTNNAPNNIGHGGIEIWGPLSSTEFAYANGADVLSIQEIYTAANTISNTKWPGFRVNGTSGYLGRIALISNTVNNPWTYQITTTGTFRPGIAPYCYNNSANGSQAVIANCPPTNLPLTTGFTCNPDQI